MVLLICCSEGQQPNYLQLPKAKSQDEPISPVVMCTQHMCPIRVHWHLKSNYKDYWRVKVTITNLNFVKNYSGWNLVMQHPNLGSLAQVFSFNFQPLFQIGETSESSFLLAIWWLVVWIVSTNQLFEKHTLIGMTHPSHLGFNYSAY